MDVVAAAAVAVAASAAGEAEPATAGFEVEALLPAGASSIREREERKWHQLIVLVALSSIRNLGDNGKKKDKPICLQPRPDE